MVEEASSGHDGIMAGQCLDVVLREVTIPCTSILELLSSQNMHLCRHQIEGVEDVLVGFRRLPRGSNSRLHHEDHPAEGRCMWRIRNQEADRRSISLKDSTPPNELTKTRINRNIELGTIWRLQL